jgi:hypothetical protein
MFKITVSAILTVCLALAAVHAQAPMQSNFKAANSERSGWAALPMLSFVVDGSLALRPMIGIPGAASVGSALDLGFEISQAHISSDHSYMVVTTPGNDWPLWMQIRPGTMAIRSMESFVDVFEECRDEHDIPLDFLSRRCARTRAARNTRATVDRIALSATGSAAALLSTSTGRIYVFTNMAGSPVLARQFEAGMPGPVSALGISDDGATAAVGISDGNAGALFVLNAGQAPRFIASMRYPSAIQFLRNQESAVIADSADNTIYSLTGGNLISMATAADGISQPVGIAVSSDNRRVFIGNSESASVVTLGLDGSAATQTHCNCTLTGLHPTNADSVFRLTDFSGRPVPLVDGNSAVPRIIFVPVNPEF